MLDNSSNKIDIGEYIAILLRRKWFIVCSVLLALAFSVLYLKEATPIYKATAVIQADPIQPNSSASDQYIMNSMVFLFYETQYDIIKSRTVAEDVVDKLELVERQKERTISTSDNNGLLQQIKLILGKDENFSLPTDEELRLSLAQSIQSGLDVEGGKQSQIINISYESKYPEETAEIVNSIADSYISFGLKSRLERLKSTSTWLNNQAEDLRVNLQKSELELKNYRLAQDLIDTEQQSRIANTQLQNLNLELIRAQTKLSESTEIYQELRKVSADGRKVGSISTILSNRGLQDISKELADSQRKINELSERYGEKHPAMIAARSDFASVEKTFSAELEKIKDSIEKQYRLDQSQVSNIKNLIEDTKSSLQSFQSDTFELTRLEREVENNRRIYESFLNRLMETDITSDYDASNIRIIDRATVPLTPVKPRAILVLIGFTFVGIFLSILIIFVYESTIKTFTTPDQLENAFSKAVVGITPLLGKTEQRETVIQYLKDKKSLFSESINSIRTGILLQNLDSPPKTILVTSSRAAEGKSTLAINLAASLSQIGPTLLLELDLRKPSIAKRLSLNSNFGVSDLITLKNPIEKLDAIRYQDSLSILTCGAIPENPTKFLSTNEFRMLIDSLRTQFEFIVIDSPPLLPVTDSAILSELSDATLIAVKASETKNNFIKETIKRLERVNANITGLVLTHASTKKMSNYGDHYYQDSYYGE